VEAQLAARRSELRQELGAVSRAKTELEIKRLRTHIVTLEELEKRLNKESLELKKRTEEIGNQSIDVEMTRGEIKQLDEVLRSIAQEREQLKVELRSASRVTLLQRAEPPEFAEQSFRVATAGLAAMVGFFIPVCLTLWRDAGAQRINSSREVSRLAGLNVLGAVPVVPIQATRQLRSPDRSTKRQHYWRALVAESVNRIAARLLYAAKQSQLRVVLVTSAVGGEGKTTLATQLALSLARTGHRALLVDFDLRRPAIDKVFDLALEPGLCEVLRSESPLSEAVRPTSIENLLVMTAGRPDRTTLRLMANSCMESLFRELRTVAEYIVVDGCPILPVADAGFISAYVDATVLAVLRDLSQAPQIRAALETLNAFVARVLGAVVTESASDVYHSVYDRDASSKDEDVTWSRTT